MSSNAPHVRDLKAHNMRFILGVKEGDHAHLFEQVRQREEENDKVQLLTIKGGNLHLRHMFTIVDDMH